MKINHKAETISEAFGVSWGEIESEVEKIHKLAKSEPKMSKLMINYFGKDNDKEFWVKLIAFMESISWVEDSPETRELSGISKKLDRIISLMENRERAKK
jgi:hypothetical protein